MRAPPPFGRLRPIPAHGDRGEARPAVTRPRSRGPGLCRQGKRMGTKFDCRPDRDQWGMERWVEALFVQSSRVADDLQPR
jgi:hypothetical protein